MTGGARAQYHLRQMFVFLNMHPVNVPEVIVTFAGDKFDSEGNLLDDNTKKFLTQLLQNLSNWTRRLRDKKHPLYRYSSAIVSLILKQKELGLQTMTRVSQLSIRYRETRYKRGPVITKFKGTMTQNR
jgi:hypothetical protein